MATEGDRDDTSLLSLSRETSTSGSRPNSRPCSPNRNHRLPTQDEVGTALQSTVEDLANQDLDTSVVVHLSNYPGALRKMEDLLPIHFYSWKLKNAEAALIYTLLHMFVLLGQYREMEGERVTYQDYVTQLKSRIAQLEEERMFEQQKERSSGDNERHREELVRLRRENAALRQSNTKLQASQDELYQINDAWARDYDSLTKKVDALTGSWSESWTNGSASAVVTSEQPRTPTHPPSLTHSSLAHCYTPAPCTKCLSLQDEVAQLNRQVKDYVRKCDRLEKSLGEREKELKQKDRMIKSLDNENQAVQLQIQEIGDLQEAMRMKEQFRKLELQMKQKEKQFQDATSQKLYLQQQVDRVRHAFMSIFGVANGSSRRHTNAHHHDCRAQQYMSEPLPPPPTPPGLIARGDHFGSLVEKDRQRMLLDEQVTGYERPTPNLSLPDPHSWPKVAKRPTRPSTLVPQSNGVQSRHIACPTCKEHFTVDGESGFSKMFDHISYCGPKR